MLHEVMSFLIVSAVIWYLFVLLTAFAANGHLASYADLFISIVFPSRSTLPSRHDSLSAALLPHSTMNAHQIAGMFSWTLNSAFINEEGKL